MLQIYNFDDWKIYDGLSAGSGRSEKKWLQSDDGRIGLFKFPKVDVLGNVSSTEYVSEHIASRIGLILGIPTASIDIGYRDGRIGCMSYLIGSIEEGVHYITRRFPTFDSDSLYASADEAYYCLNMMIESVGNTLDDGWFLPMLLFDFIIGNSDRHQCNWAIQKSENEKYRLCPLYDNGSSLCSYIQDVDVDKYIGKDTLRFEALVKSKSKSRIRIDGREKKEPRHGEVIQYVLENYEVAQELAEMYVRKLDENIISDLMMEYPIDVLPEKKRLLIERFINAKRDYLAEILKEVKNG